MSIEKLTTDIRQKQIVQATLELIAQDGLGALKMSTLARRVGLVPSALYRHFNSKDEVIDAVLNMVRARLLSHVRTVISETDDPLDQLRRLLALQAQFIRQNRGLPRLVFSEVLSEASVDRRRKVFAIATAYLAELAKIVRQGQEKGRIRSELDPDTVAMMFLGLVQPAAILWRLSNETFDVTKHVERAWKAFQMMLVRD